MQEVTGFIGDGYDVERFIRGRSRLYPDVRLTVRVMTTSDRSRWVAEQGRAAEDERADVTHRWLASRVVVWSLGAKITPENVAKLTPALYDRMFAIVWGEDGGDAIPETGKTPTADPEGDAGN